VLLPELPENNGPTEVWDRHTDLVELNSLFAFKCQKVHPTMMMSSAAADDETASAADDLLDLFSSTIQSLANDAAAIRQMTDLADVLEEDERRGDGKTTTATTTNDDPSSSSSLKSQLFEVEKVVSIMEQKVEELKDVINQENDAIEQFETSLMQEADEQEKMIASLEEQLIQNQNEMTTATTTDDIKPDSVRYGKNTTTRSSSSSISLNEQRILHQPRRMIGGMSLSSSSSSSLNRNSPVRVSTPGIKIKRLGIGTDWKNTTTDHNNDTTNDDSEEDDNDVDDDDGEKSTKMLFERITESEINDYTRNSAVPFRMNRISRMDLNEALEEIEDIVEKKMALLATTRRSLSHEQQEHQSHASSSYLTTNSLQRRFEYLQQRQLQQQRIGTTTSNVDSVSEQELRENCAFFRHGESTARATLSVLCSLKRLKQIPGLTSNKDITYICLFRDSMKNNSSMYMSDSSPIRRSPRTTS
jgi:hypothetical protein